jgi:hypothetical protein
MTTTKRNYAYDTKYESSPRQVKRREGRNAARRKLEAEGKVRKGDGKDVDHRNHNTLDNSLHNIHAMSASANRAKH